MFTPKCRVLITSKCFPEDKVICLGRQLISIVNSIKDFLPEHVWYGADIKAVGNGIMKYNINTVQLNVIGTDSLLIEYCSEIEQFIWGEFVCVDSRISSQNIQGVKLKTEDEPFRSIRCEGVLLEVRAFDSTYFEIYSEDIELIKKIANKYTSQVENKLI